MAPDVTIRGARRTAGPTIERADGTKHKPTSLPAPAPILPIRIGLDQPPLLASGSAGSDGKLLSESEWEYAARGGTSTAFHTGDRLSSDQANFDGKSRSRYNGSTNGLRRGRTTEAGQFGANRFGLHDVHGNVWEWVEDCHSSEAYQGKAPSDGRAHERSECSSQVVRGGSWDDPPGYARSASRGLNSPVIRTFIVGFRLGRSLP